MKKILKLSTLAFLLIASVSCENDDQRILHALKADYVPYNGFYKFNNSALYSPYNGSGF